MTDQLGCLRTFIQGFPIQLSAQDNKSIFLSREHCNSLGYFKYHSEEKESTAIPSKKTQ